MVCQTVGDRKQHEWIICLMHCFYYSNFDDINIHCFKTGNENQDTDSGNEYDGKKD